MALSGRQRNIGPQINILLWVLLCSLFLLNLTYKIQLATSYQPDLGGFERNVIWGIQQVMTGEPLYANPEAAPFAIIQYMPLYYFLTAFVGKAFGVSPGDAHMVYTTARCLNLFLCLISAYLLFLMARRFFQVQVLPAFGVSVTGFLWMAPFAIAGRPDTLKTCLFQILVYILLSFPSLKKPFVFTGVVLIGCLAFLAKQDGLVFCGLLPLALLFQGKPKEFFRWSAISTISAGLLIVGAMWIFGPDFLSNTVGGLQNGISISWFVGSFGMFFGFYALLFGLGLLLAWEFAESKSWQLNVVASAMVISFFPPLFFALKYGSAPNYFMEAILMSLLMLAVWLRTTSLKPLFQSPVSPSLLAVVFISLLFYIPSIQWITEIFLNQETVIEGRYRNQKEVADYVHDQLENNDAWVLVDVQRQWEDHLTTLLFDKVVSPQRDVVLQVVNAKGRIDFTPLQTAIEKGSVRFFITDAGQAPVFLNAGSLKCKLLKTIGSYQVWTRE